MQAPQRLVVTLRNDCPRDDCYWITQRIFDEAKSDGGGQLCGTTKTIVMVHDEI